MRTSMNSGTGGGTSTKYPSTRRPDRKHGNGSPLIRIALRHSSANCLRLKCSLIGELEANSMIRRNTTARCATPVLVVAKPGDRGFRMTVDLRAVNAITIPIAWPMPIFEVVLEYLRGASRFEVQRIQRILAIPSSRGLAAIFSFYDR